MFFFFYNITSIFLVLPVSLYHWYRSVSRGRSPAFKERFGFLPREELAKIGGRPVIWLHAVSVGEAIAARPLLKALRAKYPCHAILVSNTTETGRAITSSFPEKDISLYFPFDFLPAVRRALEHIKPELIIIMETEIWPNFTRQAALRGIPVILANGRISDRSYSRYLAFKWFFRHALQLFSNLCMQTEVDRERIIAIGAPPERTLRIGNLKYDIPFRHLSPEDIIALKEHYTIPHELSVICAGSSHPGEEEHIISAYRELLVSRSDLFLVLVPRHPERAANVAALLANAGLAYRRRTDLAATSDVMFRSGEVLLVNTIGELMGLYALSDVVFVGGSLVPTGGHNLLEPASVGVPTIFGPHMTNFREIAALVLQHQAGIQVDTPADLAEAFQKLLSEPVLRQELGRNGLLMMRENGGATERHMEIIAGYLDTKFPSNNTKQRSN
ncbi:3-deoxy-D-manno-octulosonic acid transferase [Pelotalea chapellei]|uniref:3-deoxy-D-manno-octulosonic acid transferase n=1 Tax=Pelotalea chapellei TaxID=44671 RepID=A0ABS5U6S9_9BACT|nr:3-deoxy-D-manno-octulosonic acid transferase [Pelotalea chapellei]MBT1071359.1 3-deoxy-D-manno-octulosonic acid transferase [Pelotalea chapellei]